MIKILVVDDSALVRKILSEELSKIDDFDVVGSATDPYMAREKIVKLQPDVLTLDIEMPRMDGLSFLEKLMKHYPMPVVIVSSLTPENSETALRALELGAIDVVSKPGSGFSTPDINRMVRAVRTAAAANTKVSLPKDKTATVQSPAVAASKSKSFELKTTHKVIAIGASTGGTKAVEVVLQNLPSVMPGIVIVQHMPEVFTASFAARLNSICELEVREARDNDYVVPGMVLVAPGNSHMLLQRSGAKYYVSLKDGPPVHHQRPSVDVLFHSVARNAGSNALGMILTGMGADGAKGLQAMHDNGAYTFAQDEKSCVVFGMPKEAIKMGAVDKIIPLDQCASALIEHLQKEV